MANVTSKSCGDSQLVVCLTGCSTWPRKMEPFEDHLSGCECLPGLRNKPGKKEIDELLAVVDTWTVSSCSQPSNIGEKCLSLYAHKYSFGKSDHKYISKGKGENIYVKEYGQQLCYHCRAAT